MSSTIERPSLRLRQTTVSLASSCRHTIPLSSSLFSLLSFSFFSHHTLRRAYNTHTIIIIINLTCRREEAARETRRQERERGWSREEREGLCLLTHVRLANPTSKRERDAFLSRSVTRNSCVACVCVSIAKRAACVGGRGREKGSHAGEAEQRQVISVKTTLVPGSWFRLC